MCCRILELRDKQVICIKDGTIVGAVCDLLFDRLASSVVFPPGAAHISSISSSSFGASTNGGIIDDRFCTYIPPSS